MYQLNTDSFLPFLFPVFLNHFLCFCMYQSQPGFEETPAIPYNFTRRRNVVLWVNLKFALSGNNSCKAYKFVRHPNVLSNSDGLFQPSLHHPNILKSRILQLQKRHSCFYYSNLISCLLQLSFACTSSVSIKIKKQVLTPLSYHIYAFYWKVFISG